MNANAELATASDINAEIGALVHQAMFRARTTQVRLAPVLGIGQSALSKKLRGVVPWTAAELLMVAKVLGTDVTDLMPSPELCAVRDSNPEPADSVSAGAVIIPFRRTRRMGERRTPPARRAHRRQFRPFPYIALTS